MSRKLSGNTTPIHIHIHTHKHTAVQEHALQYITITCYHNHLDIVNNNIHNESCIITIGKQVSCQTVIYIYCHNQLLCSLIIIIIIMACVVRGQGDYFVPVFP